MSKTMDKATKGKKSSVKQKASLTDCQDKVLNRAERISHIIGSLSQFTPINYETAFDMKPLFAREFLLKNLLGLSDEEFVLNEELILSEQNELIKSMQLAHDVLQMQEETNGIVEKTKSKKIKEKVS